MLFYCWTIVCDAGPTIGVTFSRYRYRIYFFHPLEVVSRFRDPQRQVGDKYTLLFNLIPEICK